MSPIPWLGITDAFPDPSSTVDPDPDVPGLFAVSEHIYPGQLSQAYQLGLFPWYSDRQPVLWWSPDPRMVLSPQQFIVSKSLHKTLRLFYQQPNTQIEVDQHFDTVLRACATVQRKNQDGTWITHEIIEAYTALYEAGHAHSIAVTKNGQLAGGLYCVNFGGMVYGESMFSHTDNASKIALAALCAWCYDRGVEIIDCQQETPHLHSLGARPIARAVFLQHIRKAIQQNQTVGPWSFDKAILQRWL
jgi:leucyl/phenylalanyl-tRNA--protein transferase